MSTLKTAGLLSVLTLTLATSVVALSSTTASAQWRHGGEGPGVAAGVIGGLAVGALAAGAYGPYYGTAPYRESQGDCYLTPRKVWNGYRWVIRRVEVCE